MQQRETLRIELFGQVCYVDGALDRCQHLKQVTRGQDTLAGSACKVRADIARSLYACIGTKFDQTVSFSCVSKTPPRLVQVWCGL